MISLRNFSDEQLKTSIKPLIQIWDKKNQEPDFYFEKIFPLIKERCRREIQNAQDVESTPKRIKLNGSNNYEVLILPVGYALEPLLITSSILNPKSIHLIFSQDTQKLRESLYRRFEELCGITKEYITENVLKEDELSGTYHSIRSWWKRLKVNLPGISKDQIAVDISGGKKSMVSGAQLAANIFGFHVYYIDFEEFDIKQRRLVHGTEFINSLNPQLDAVFEGMEFGAKQLLEKVSIPEILAGFKNFVESNGGAINAFWESRLSCKLKSSPEGIGQGLLLISH